MRIGEVAQLLGHSTVWLRYRERAGTLPKAQRDWRGWRVYSEEDYLRILASLPLRITGTIFYVAASGSDNNDGLTPDTALRTVPCAQARASLRDCIVAERSKEFWE